MRGYSSAVSADDGTETDLRPWLAERGAAGRLQSFCHLTKSGDKFPKPMMLPKLPKLAMELIGGTCPAAPPACWPPLAAHPDGPGGRCPVGRDVGPGGTPADADGAADAATAEGKVIRSGDRRHAYVAGVRVRLAVARG
jgi:hypothetical protein